MIRSIRERRAQSVSGVSAASDSGVDTVTTGAAVPGRISLTSRDGPRAPIERSIPSREEKPAAREHGDRVFAALAGPGASEDDDHSASAPATATMTKAEVMTRAELQAVIDKHLTMQSAAANATNDDEHERAAREHPARDDDPPSPPPVGFFDETLTPTSVTGFFMTEKTYPASLPDAPRVDFEPGGGHYSRGNGLHPGALLGGPDALSVPFPLPLIDRILDDMDAGFTRDVEDVSDDTAVGGGDDDVAGWGGAGTTEEEGGRAGWWQRAAALIRGDEA
jgi:hypothetical protein